MLESNAASTKRSLQDLYEVGAISGSQYTTQSTAVYSKLAVDIANLQNSYLEANIYNYLQLNIRITNANSVPVSVRVYYSVAKNDLTVFNYSVAIPSILANSYIDWSFEISSGGKKTNAVTITSIVIQ